jgi:hypothetical protein
MKIFKHLRSDWFRYGFETLAVVVGILVAFQTIKSMGTENVTASELKKDIVHHYDVAYIRLDKIIDRVNNSFANTNHELDLKHFRVISDREGKIPTNYEALLNDDLYLNYLYNRKGWKINYIRFNSNMIREAGKLMEKIKQEIEK